MSKERKPRKAVAKARKAPARKAMASNGTPKGQWVPSATNKDPVGRALGLAIKAFKGNKSDLAAWLDIKKPNLSRALREAKAVEEGTGDKVTWPAPYYIKLAKVSGLKLHELNPAVYEPQHKTTRFKPKFVDGRLAAE